MRTPRATAYLDAGGLLTTEVSESVLACRTQSPRQRAVESKPASTHGRSERNPLIGTVEAVASTLISDFAFYLDDPTVDVNPDPGRTDDLSD